MMRRLRNSGPVGSALRSGLKVLCGLPFGLAVLVATFMLEARLGRPPDVCPWFAMADILLAVVAMGYVGKLVERRLPAVEVPIPPVVDDSGMQP